MGFLKRRRKVDPPRPYTQPEVRVPKRANAPLIAPPGAFDRIDVVRDSIQELYRKLSGDTVKSFSANLAPALAELPPADTIGGTQRMALTMARHLGITEARLIVAFATLGGGGPKMHAGEVELGPGPEYYITLDSRYRSDPRDIPAVLAHEVMHVFLHRHGIRFPDTGRNEILTDTATIYLGIGWLMMMANRVEVSQSGHTRRTSTSTLGYLSPAEMGYVLAKRALAFDEDIEAYLATNSRAREAYRLGRIRAREDYACAPLEGCAKDVRAQYTKDKKYAVELTASTGMSGLVRPFAGGYRFDGHDPVKVTFPCPACHHQTRVTIDKTATARCGVCRSTFSCRT